MQTVATGCERLRMVRRTVQRTVANGHATSSELKAIMLAIAQIISKHNMVGKRGDKWGSSERQVIDKRESNGYYWIQMEAHAVISYCPRHPQADTERTEAKSRGPSRRPFQKSKDPIRVNSLGQLAGEKWGTNQRQAGEIM